MTTIAQIVKQIVTESIDQDYIKDCGKSSLREVYESEYGYNGVSAKACKDYLQGLPSVCTIPFYNNEILEILAKEGITRKPDSSAECNLIEQYWETAGKVFHQMIK